MSQSEQLLLVIGATAPFVAILASCLPHNQPRIEQGLILTPGVVILGILAFASLWRRLSFDVRVLVLLFLLLDLGYLWFLAVGLSSGGI